MGHNSKLDRIEECIIANLNRFNIHQALRQYDLSIDDLNAYMEAAVAGFKQKQQEVG